MATEMGPVDEREGDVVHRNSVRGRPFLNVVKSILVWCNTTHQRLLTPTSSHFRCLAEYPRSRYQWLQHPSSWSGTFLPERQKNFANLIHNRNHRISSADSPSPCKDKRFRYRCLRWLWCIWRRCPSNLPHSRYSRNVRCNPRGSVRKATPSDRSCDSAVLQANQWCWMPSKSRIGPEKTKRNLFDKITILLIISSTLIIRLYRLSDCGRETALCTRILKNPWWDSENQIFKGKMDPCPSFSEVLLLLNIFQAIFYILLCRWHVLLTYVYTCRRNDLHHTLLYHAFASFVNDVKKCPSYLDKKL